MRTYLACDEGHQALDEGILVELQLLLRLDRLELELPEGNTDPLPASYVANEVSDVVRVLEEGAPDGGGHTWYDCRGIDGSRIATEMTEYGPRVHRQS